MITYLAAVCTNNTDRQVVSQHGSRYNRSTGICQLPDSEVRRAQNITWTR